MDDASSPIAPVSGLNEFQRFGAHGPAYQVIGPGADPEMVRVRVLKSGEEFDYRLIDARTDPPA
jgi:Family of unknown function (DUF5397)